MKLKSISAARRILDEVDLVSDVYNRRWEWVDAVFVPAVKTLARSANRTDRRRAAFGYYILGDVHDFNHAPRAAIRAYRRCLALEPDDGSAWREIGSMLDSMGQAKAAVSALRRAVRLDPKDDYARQDLDSILKYPAGQPLFVRGDPVWTSCELLASGRPREALNALARRRSPPARRQRARAFGALRESGAAFSEWKALVDSGRNFELEGADLYFMSDETWNDHAVWATLWRGRSRVTCSNLFWPDPPPDAHGRRYLEMQLRFHLARTNGPAFRRRLASRYPYWNEARELCEGGTGAVGRCTTSG